MTVLSWSAPPRIVAHRGASAEAPENTLAAFERALETTPAVELDVQLSRDGVPVVLHDPELERTTTGRGAVGERTAAELRALSAGAWFGPAFARERVPTLDDVFERVGERALLNVELKFPEAYPDLVEKVGRLVLERGARERVLATSFDPDAVHAFKVRWPEIRAGVICATIPDPDDLDRWAAWADALVLRHPAVTAAVLHRAKRQGLLVGAWTVNDRPRALDLWARGVDFVISDDPRRIAGDVLS